MRPLPETKNVSLSRAHIIGRVNYLIAAVGEAEGRNRYDPGPSLIHQLLAKGCIFTFPGPLVNAIERPCTVAP